MASAFGDLLWRGLFFKDGVRAYDGVCPALYCIRPGSLVVDESHVLDGGQSYLRTVPPSAEGPRACTAIGRAACDLHDAAATLCWHFPDNLEFFMWAAVWTGPPQDCEAWTQFRSSMGPMGAISVLACAATSLQKHVRGWIARKAWRKMRTHFAMPIQCGSAGKLADVALYEDVRHVPGIARIAFDNVSHSVLYRALGAIQMSRGR